MADKTRTTIYMEKTQADRLTILSKETKVPQAVYVRDGINKVLDENRELIERAKFKKP